MKIEVNIDKFKEAVISAERITGKNLTLPVLNSVLLIASGKSLKVRATNLSVGIEIEMSAKIEKDGVLAVKGDVLSNTFSNIGQNENGAVTLEESNGNLSVKTKNHTVVLKGQSSEDFPTIPVIEGESFEIESKKFFDGIRSVFYSASNSDIKPEISSVYVYGEGDNLVFVATDSFRLAEKKIKMKNASAFKGVIIPLKNAMELMKIIDGMNGEMKVIFSKNQIAFFFDHIYFTSRIIDGSFPDYKQIIPKESATEAIVLKQDLLNAVKISNVFSDKFNQAEI